MSFLSIIIPLYNKEKHIKTTIESVLEQTFQDFEIIIINDGSTDDSEILVHSISDSRIKYFKQENKGVSAARNSGIEKSSAKLIAFLDADDYWHPNHLKHLKTLFETFPGCGIYATGYEEFYFNNTLVKGNYHDLPLDFTGIIPDYFHHSIIDPIAWTSAVAIPKIIFETYGNFNTQLRSGQDTDLWIRIALKEKVAFSIETTARRTITNTNNHLSNSEKKVDRLQILDRYKTEELSHKSFKKYIDLNRFSVAIERKINGDKFHFRKLIQDIDYNNLNFKQKLLLKAPAIVLKFIKKVQVYLINKGIYLSAFK